MISALQSTEVLQGQARRERTGTQRRAAGRHKQILLSADDEPNGHSGESILSKLSRAIDAILTYQFPGWWLAVAVLTLILAGRFLMG